MLTSLLHVNYYYYFSFREEQRAILTVKIRKIMWARHATGKKGEGRLSSTIQQYAGGGELVIEELPQSHNLSVLLMQDQLKRGILQYFKLPGCAWLTFKYYYLVVYYLDALSSGGRQRTLRHELSIRTSFFHSKTCCVVGLKKYSSSNYVYYLLPISRRRQDTITLSALQGCQFGEAEGRETLSQAFEAQPKKGH